MKTHNDLLIQVSQLYYFEGLTQAKISRELGIHRTTISKLLKEAKDKNIVSITINTSLGSKNILSSKIESKYGIKKVVLVPVTTDMTILQRNQMIVQGSLDYLKSLIKDNMTLGFSWGRAMYTLSQNLFSFNVNNVTCVPMIGGPSGRLENEYHVNNITYQSSKDLNGQALMIDAPAFPENESIRNSLINDENNQRIINSWKDIDCAFFGIGSPILKKDKQWKEFYGQDIFDDFSNENIAGDIVSRFFDHSGNHIHNKLDDTIIGISPEELIRIENKICIVESIDKVDAVRAALKGDYINILLTTEDIGNSLLD